MNYINGLPEDIVKESRSFYTRLQERDEDISREWTRLYREANGNGREIPQGALEKFSLFGKQLRERDLIIWKQLDRFRDKANSTLGPFEKSLIQQQYPQFKPIFTAQIGDFYKPFAVAQALLRAPSPTAATTETGSPSSRSRPLSASSQSDSENLNLIISDYVSTPLAPPPEYDALVKKLSSLPSLSPGAKGTFEHAQVKTDVLALPEYLSSPLLQKYHHVIGPHVPTTQEPYTPPREDKTLPMTPKRKLCIAGGIAAFIGAVIASVFSGGLLLLIPLVAFFLSFAIGSYREKIPSQE